MPICGMLVLASVSCSKNSVQTKSDTPKESNHAPYVKRDGQAGWTTYHDVERDCFDAGNTCAPEVVITYDPSFWDILLEEWERKCNDDPYWNFSAKANEDSSLKDLLANANFELNFCQVHGISSMQYKQMTIGQYFTYVFPTATPAIMSKMESGDYTIKFRDLRSGNGKTFLMGAPNGVNPETKPEFVLKLKF